MPEGVGVSSRSSALPDKKPGATSSAISSQGIKGLDDFVKLLSLVIVDVLEQRLDAESANAVVGLSRQVLRALELKERI